MTVTTATRRAGPFVGNGVTTLFPFAFKVFDASDLDVILTDGAGNQSTLVLGTHYTIALNSDQDNDPGGTITYPISGAAMAWPNQLVGIGGLEYEQQTDISNVGRFLPQVIENALDYVTILIQQMLEQLERTLRFPAGSTSVVDVPTAALRAGKYLAFDALGNPTVSVGTGADLGLRTDLAAGSGAALVGYTPAFGPNTSVSGELNKLQANSREKLFANRTYYVRTDGSDLHDGLTNTAGGAFKTKQWAADIILNTLDLNSYSVTVIVGAGAYTGGVQVDAPWTGKGTVTFQGDTVTPANCTVTTANDCFFIQNGARLKVRGFKVSSVNGTALKAYLCSSLDYDSMNFGTCGYMHVEQGTGSAINCVGSYTISGGAQGHLHSGSFGMINVPSTVTVTLTGVPVFTVYFMGCAQGVIVWDGPTVVGTATGKQFLAHYGGFIRTPIAFNFASIPGSTNGTMEAGGWISGGQAESLKFAPDIYTANILEIQAVNFNTQLRSTFFKTANDLFTPQGWFFANGQDCYSTHRTHFGGNTTAVDVTSGATDGATFQEPGFPVLNMSNNSNPSINMRRRTTDGSVMNFYRNTTAVGSVSVTTTATAYNTSSDYRLKQNVAPITDAWERVKALKPVRYEFKVEPGTTVSGFLAHELAEVCPQAVHGEKDAVDEKGEPVYQGVDTGKLVADLTAALQQALARIEALEAR